MSEKQITEVFQGFAGGNYRFTALMGETRNKNCLRIHDQSIGESYEIANIWDTDLFKIVRYLKTLEFDHRTDIFTVCDKLNKICNHLFISVETVKQGGFEYMDGFIGWGDFK